MQAKGRWRARVGGAGSVSGAGDPGMVSSQSSKAQLSSSGPTTGVDAEPEGRVPPATTTLAPGKVINKSEV